MTDTQLLNWIESQGTPRRKWIVRPSSCERGYRVHQVTKQEEAVWGEHLCAKTLRGAVEIAVAEAFKANQLQVETLLKNTCRPGSRPEHHAGPCGLVYVGEKARQDRCACGCSKDAECKPGVAARPEAAA